MSTMTETDVTTTQVHRIYIQATPEAIQSTGTWLQANTAWNITNIIAARMIGPRTG